LYIETNFNNWGSGAVVDAHRISHDWQETAATWNCAVDTNLSNSAPDCEDDEWPGGFYDEYVSASLLHQNSQLGWKSFNVTADVQLVQNDYDHFGWLLRKRDPAAAGSVDYTSIQGVSFDTNTTVESWAAAATVSCSGLDKGIAHFEHLEDGSEQDPAPVDCAPTTETRYIDCDSYNQLGDITGLSNFCTLAGSSCPALSATQYCDSVCY
jgi:hypothetical protein